jgi:hypothetical protein
MTKDLVEAGYVEYHPVIFHLAASQLYGKILPQQSCCNKTL